MRRELLGLGLAGSLLFGCAEGESESTQESTVPSGSEQGCVEYDVGYSSSLKISSRFVLKHCESLGLTELYEGADGAEVEFMMFTFEDNSNGKELTCLVANNSDYRAGSSIDCNWEEYNSAVNSNE